MARPLRIEVAGGLYHVTSRGDRREDIFLDDADRLAWLDSMQAIADFFGVHYARVSRAVKQGMHECKT